MRMTDKTTKDMVIVEWHDACLFPDAYTEDECKKKKMSLFNSLGYLISQDNTTTIIAAELDDRGKYRNVTLIPSGSIVSVKSLLTSSLRIMK